jgi:branched-subunit amino acid aminotransferase/4-amino-4-deoxychorismate lyase
MKFFDLPPSTGLIETMLWTPEAGIFLKELHLQRLKNSADVLDFTMKNLEIIENSWKQAVEGRQSPQKIRSLSYQDGSLEVTTEPFENVLQKWRIVVSEYRLDSGDMLLRHKTTQRFLYNRERERIKGLADEIIFLNERGEVCEGAITNIFVQSDGGLLTPPLSCGVLPGTLRAHLLETGAAREAILTLQDLHSHPFFVGNALRGLIPSDIASLI